MKYWILVLVFAFGFVCQTQAQNKDEYKISGEIKGLDVNVGYMATEDPTAPRGWRVDFIAFENGKFEYTSEVEEPEVLRMSFRSDKLMKMVGRGYIPTKAVLLHFIAYLIIFR